MKTINIIGIDRGLIKVQFDKKEIFITGELTTDKFYADIDSIKKWEPPYEKEIINEIEKKEIIKSIEEKTKKAATPIVFD